MTFNQQHIASVRIWLADCNTASSCALFVRQRTRWCVLDGLQEAQRSKQSGLKGTTQLALRQHKDLTPREREIGRLVELNLPNDEIARRLGIKPGTVKIHVRIIFIKGGLSPRSLRGGKKDAVIERIREAQRRRWQHWRATKARDRQ